MNAWRKLAAVALVCAPFLAACTETPETAFDWGVNDVFVVPPWKRYFHNAASEAVLFSISDRPAQDALGLWREGN